MRDRHLKFHEDRDNLVPRNTPHSWRNIAAAQSRLLGVLTPGGFEQIVYAVKDAPPEKIAHLAAEFGCDILGPPVADERPRGVVGNATRD